MLQNLRLINPPGRRRRKASAKRVKSWPKYATKSNPKRRKTVAKPIKTVRTARGVRYMRGGKFISKAAVKRSRAAKRRAKANPVRKAAPKKRAAPKRKAAPKRRVVRTRKRKATTSKRRNPVAKTRRISKAGRARMRAGGRKGGKAAARKTRRNPPKRKRKKSTRRKNPRQWTKKKVYGKKRTVSKAKFVTRKGPRSKKTRTRRISRSVTKKGNYRYGLPVTKNPMNAMKNALAKGAAFWAGLTGMRVINRALKVHVTDKYATTLGQFAPVIPALAGFLVSTVIVPRVTKKKVFVESLQLGATVALLDAAFDTWVRPALIKPKADGSASALAPYFSGYGEMTVYEPVSEYVDYDNRLGEGMSDYVPDNRYGQFEVTEALAMEEIDYMQRGGAGGVFAKTSLGRG